jgi:signal transduction histidine kinase/ActR/RegA family two-component response regulator
MESQDHDVPPWKRKPVELTMAVSDVQMISGDADGPDGMLRDSQVHAEKVSLLYSHCLSSVCITLMNAILLALIQWDYVPNGTVVAWLTFMVLVSIYRMALGIAFRMKQPGAEEAAQWGRWYTLGSGLAGIGWGLAGLLLIPETSVPRQFFTTFVLAGMSAAAMTIMSPVYPAYVAFLVPTGAPIFLVFALDTDALHRAAAFMILLFVVFLLKSGRVYSGLVHRSLTLAQDKTHLVGHLAHEKSRIEELNRSLRQENNERIQAEKALEHRLRLESLITSFSNGFINLSPRYIDAGIRDALARLGEFSGVDRSFLFLLDRESQTASKTHEWVAEGVQSAVEPFRRLPIHNFPWILERLERSEVVLIPRTTDLPPEALAERSLIESQSVQSCLVVPVLFGESLIGFLGFSSLREERTWDEETVLLLRVVGEIFANALEHKRTQEELMLARDAAEAAAQAKSRFLANMSHEIRTPLHGVLGMLQLLQGSSLDDTQRKYAISAQVSGAMLLSLLDDILDFSKIEAGKMRIGRSDLELGPVALEVVQMLSDSARAKDLSLQLTTDPEHLSPVRGDATRLRQILANLIGNAIKFTANGGVQVCVSQGPTEAGETLVRFEVRDTGIGIPLDMQAGLFDPFTQADSSSTRRYGGTGLGLAICRQLVELMGGRIGVVSTPGQGSTFWFELEMEQASQGGIPDPGDISPSGTVLDPPRFEGFRVLVVEDNPTNQEVAAIILSHMGLEVDLAENGRQAMDLIDQHRYHLVFMDCQMPVMDGFEATRLIREGEARSGAPRMPIVALTGNAMEGDRQICIGAGMDDYLPKPFTIGEVSRMLSRWLNPSPDGHGGKMPS